MPPPRKVWTSAVLGGHRHLAPLLELDDDDVGLTVGVVAAEDEVDALELIGNWHSMLTPASSGTVDRRSGATTRTRLLPQLVNSLSDTPMLSRLNLRLHLAVDHVVVNMAMKKATVFW